MKQIINLPGHSGSRLVCPLRPVAGRVPNAWGALLALGILLSACAKSDGTQIPQQHNFDNCDCVVMLPSEDSCKQLDLLVQKIPVLLLTENVNFQYLIYEGNVSQVMEGQPSGFPVDNSFAWDQCQITVNNSAFQNAVWM